MVLCIYFIKNKFIFIEGQIYIEIKSYVHIIHIILQMREDMSFLNVSVSIAKLIGGGGGVIYLAEVVFVT